MPRKRGGRIAVKPNEVLRDEIAWRAESAVDSTSELPDIIEWVLSDKYLNRNLYPIQGTMLKIWSLQTELFTSFDMQMIETWSRSFTQTGDNGTQPDILERIEICKAEGRPWFREWINILGRRGSKGYIGACAMSYVLAHYIAKGNPQRHYNIDQDKHLAMLIFAGKKEAAIKNQWGDINNVIIGSPFFYKFLPEGTLHKEELHIFSPNDVVRLIDRDAAGIYSQPDTLASFEILPKESTLMSSRGPAVFAEAFDEFAFITRETAKVSACLGLGTRVLTADLRWVPIETVKVGDRLIGVDESPLEGKQQRGMRESVVEATQVFYPKDNPWELTFDDGTVVVCSGNHRWFNGKRSEWNPTDNLRVGSEIRYAIRPWDENLSGYDQGYLAGVFDGEGSVVTARGPKPVRGVSFAQNPGLVADYVLSVTEKYGFNFYIRRLNGGLGGNCSTWRLRGGLDEDCRFLGQVRPHRLLPKAHNVWEGVAPHGVRKIVQKRRLAESVPLVDLQTSTRTYIAEGLVSHNSELWDQATPALDTFKQDAFIYEGSSPWAMIGQFYQNSRQALAVSDGNDGFEKGKILRPEILMFQLESWSTYLSWERADKIAVRPAELSKMDPRYGFCFPRQSRSLQEYDDNMRRLEAANPEKFSVERRSRWAAVMDAYLSPDRVDQMFEPWPILNPLNTGPKSEGKFIYEYYAHSDPSKSGKNTSLVICHRVDVGADLPHVVVDLVTHWEPSQFTNNNFEIDYEQILGEMQQYCRLFMPNEFTFDQGFSAFLIQGLRKYIQQAHLPRQVNVFERTATLNSNWRVAETFKTAIGMGLVHCYSDTRSAELLRQECKFLQLVNEKRVDHPTAGPVQTKDVWDSLAILVDAMLGKHIAALMGRDMMAVGLSGSQPGGFAPSGMFGPSDKPSVNTVAGQMQSMHRRPPSRPSSRGGRFQNPRGRMGG